MDELADQYQRKEATRAVVAWSRRGDVTEKSYAHRTLMQKLGVRPGAVVAIVGPEEDTRALAGQARETAGRPLASGSEPVDVALVWINSADAAVDILRDWRSRLEPAGGVWLLTPKRGQPGYVDQQDLIEAGKLADLVDNKVCSVSDTTSAIRFVIRRRDRIPGPQPAC